MNLRQPSARRTSFRFLYAVALANVLLILFLFLTLPGVIFAPSGISVSWPSKSVTAAAPGGRFVLTLARDHVLYVRSEKMTLDQFERSLTIRPVDNLTILIKADARAEIGDLVRVWSLLRHAGAETIHIATNE
ncbi:MAG: biopolymer transporter ExbD [Candidatus Omnitrophota bacterium]